MRSKKTLLISFILFFSLCFAFIPSFKVDAAVKLNKSKVTLYTGKSTTLKLKGTKKKAKWTSSNKKVATVNSKGKVKAKKKGTAKITAKVGNKKYTCKVTVKAKKKNPCATGHHYDYATCTLPEICTQCGKKNGNALGHDYLDATCTSPQICTRCRNSIGSALGHDYLDATCTSAKTCSRCDSTIGNALGHDYLDGSCNRCGDENDNYIKTLNVGETWVVDGQWKLTINSVERHNLCNSFSEINNLPECIIITYSYENIGYTDDLYICDFYIYDAEGEAAELYPCTHLKSPKVCKIGTKCTNAQVAYALYNDSSQITLFSEKYTSSTDFLKIKKVKFNLPVN